MRGSIFVAALLLLAGVSGFEEESAENKKIDLQLSWRDGVFNAYAYLKKLKIQLADFNRQIAAHRATKFPNVMELILNNTEYVSLRERLVEIWPGFWKVPKRQMCEKELDDEINAYLESFDLTIKNYFNTADTLEIKTTEMKYNIEDALYALTLNHQRNLERCEKDEYCKTVNKKVEAFEKSALYVDNVLDWMDNFNNTWRPELLVPQDVRPKFLIPTYACIDNYN